ncbi:MAG: hypothetical protein ACRDBT_12035 [Aeromonas sp.]
METHKELINKLTTITYAGTQKIPISKVVEFLYYDLIALKNKGLSWAGIANLINSNDFGVIVNPRNLMNLIYLIKKKPPIKTAIVEQVNTVEPEPVKRVNRFSTPPVNVVEQVNAVEPEPVKRVGRFSKPPVKPKFVHNNNPNLDDLIREIEYENSKK